MASSAPPPSKMFISTVSSSLEEAHFCFNKMQFTRTDFDVHRFMKITRRRAELKQIHQDLRLYLKSIQNSMIELINDDYAHFVHLSSSLVALKDSIDKIHKSIEGSWKEFVTSAKDAVIQAEKVEQRCLDAAANRDAQTRIRHQISAVAAIKNISTHLKAAPETASQIWLERLSCLIVDAVIHADSLDEESRAMRSYDNVLRLVETKLGDEAVASLHSDCSLLPLILSALSLCSASDRLTSRVVAHVIEPLVQLDSRSDKLKLLCSCLEQVKKLRQDWSDRLGKNFIDPVSTFLDHSLLTYVILFTDKYLGAVVSGTDRVLFHACFSSVSSFISAWPTPSTCRLHLSQLRAKFIIEVYFKMFTQQWNPLVERQLPPDAFKRKEKSGKADEGEGEGEQLQCVFSVTVLNAIRAAWEDESYLAPLAPKYWEFTIKLLNKYLAWIRAIRIHYSREDSEWLPLLFSLSDAPRLPQLVFDLALERIWPKLRDLKVDTTLFGQTLTALSSTMKNEESLLEDAIVHVIYRKICLQLDSVSQVPKQYRWTKKPTPSSPSVYMATVVSEVERLRVAASSTSLPSAALEQRIWADAALYLAKKANEVVESVEATGSSLSRLKRREGTAGSGSVYGETDDDKIRAQISIDLCEMRRWLQPELQKDADQALFKVLGRLSATKETSSSNGMPSQTNGVREPSA